jgi:hypothetical protein
LSRADEQVLVDAVAARIPTWKSGLFDELGESNANTDNSLRDRSARLNLLQPLNMGNWGN